MLKKSFSIIIFLLFLTTIFSGCFEEEYKTEEDKFIGRWKAEEEKGYKDRAFQFFKNGTCYIMTYKLKGTYHINKAENILIVNQSSPKDQYVYSYSFNYNYDKLTLTNQDDFTRIMYKRLE